MGSAFYEEDAQSVVALTQHAAGGSSAEDEMDTDHFNELDRIFDLPYGAEQDPFGSGGGGGQSQGQANGQVHGHQQQQGGQHGGAGLLMPTPLNGHSHGGGGHHMNHSNHGSSHGGGMDWHVKEEDASYHTAVDASSHIDMSYHHVDASGHSMIDASGHSMMDASGHDSLIDSSGHYDDYAAHKGDPRYMEHSCEACKRSKVRKGGRAGGRQGGWLRPWTFTLGLSKGMLRIFCNVMGWFGWGFFLVSCLCPSHVCFDLNLPLVLALFGTPVPHLPTLFYSHTRSNHDSLHTLVMSFLLLAYFKCTATYGRHTPGH